MRQSMMGRENALSHPRVILPKDASRGIAAWTGEPVRVACGVAGLACRGGKLIRLVVWEIGMTERECQRNDDDAVRVLRGGLDGVRGS